MNKDLVINGVRLSIDYIYNNDKRPTVVFLHDSLGCIELWRDFPEKLAEATDCNVLVYDRQGHGQAAPFGPEQRGNSYLEDQADVLHLLLEQYDIREALLFGHSDGGSIALIAAAKYPDRIKAVIAEAAHIFVEEITLKGVRDAVIAYETTNLKEKLQRYHRDKTEALFRAWSDTWLKAEYRSWSVEHLLPQISCPVLIIQGRADNYGSLAQVTEVITRVSGIAQTLILPGTGHTPHKEASEIVLNHSAAFINLILPAEG